MLFFALRIRLLMLPPHNLRIMKAASAENLHSFPEDFALFSCHPPRQGSGGHNEDVSLVSPLPDPWNHG